MTGIQIAHLLSSLRNRNETISGDWRQKQMTQRYSFVSAFI